MTGFACAMFVCLPTSALAKPRAGDVAATQAYLRASEAYARAFYPVIGKSVAAIEARASEIASQCPSALSYAPRDEAFGELAEEVEKTVLYASVAPMRSAALRFSMTIALLRWSDRELDRLVGAQAREERMIATVALPDVCADIAAWKAGAYAQLPRTAAIFAARQEKIESLSEVGHSEESREKVLARDLRRYEGLAERRLVKRIEQLETLIDKQIGRAAQAAEKKLAIALGASVL